MRWSEAATLQFVRLYLGEACLWDPGQPGYKLRERRHAAYQRIAAQFRAPRSPRTLHAPQAPHIPHTPHLSVPEVKNKIKNLRTTYSQQVHKILSRSSDPDHPYVPSLVWFHEMDEQLKHLPRNLTGAKWHAADDGTENEQPSQPVDGKIWLESTLPENPDDELHPDPLVPPSADDYVAVVKAERYSPRVKSERKPSFTNYKVKKKKLKRKRELSSPLFIKDESNTQISHSPTIPAEDEFDIYGKFVASQLRKLNLKEALKAQVEISRLMAGARLANMSDGQDSSLS